MTYKKGDRVWWWSKESGFESRSLAIFVRYDGGKTDCILAVKGNQFRWPTALIGAEEKYTPPRKPWYPLPKRKAQAKKRKKPRK